MMETKIQKINEALQASIIALIGYNATSMLYGLAEPVLIRDTDAEQTLPAIVKCDGECINVFKECDVHDVTLYHRLQSKSYTAKAGYGGRITYDEVCEMSLIVYGFRKAVNPYELEKTLCKAIIEDSARSIGSTDFNAIQVFATEYSGMPFILNPDFFLFKINYRITSTLNRCTK